MAIDTKGKSMINDLTTLSEQEMKKQAKVFSEGNSELEQILIELWKNGVQTIGCCSGHNGKEVPYISFYIDTLEDGLLSDLLLDTLKKDSEILSISIKRGHSAIEEEFDDVGNVVGQVKRSRPININFGFKSGFEINGFLEIIKSIFSTTHEDYEERLYNLEKENDIKWIQDIIDLKTIDIENLDFSRIENMASEDMGGHVELRVSQYEIQRDEFGWVEHLDDYEVNFGSIPKYLHQTVKTRLQTYIKSYKRLQDFSYIEYENKLDSKVVKENVDVQYEEDLDLLL